MSKGICRGITTTARHLKHDPCTQTNNTVSVKLLTQYHGKGTQHILMLPQPPKTGTNITTLDPKTTTLDPKITDSTSSTLLMTKYRDVPTTVTSSSPISEVYCTLMSTRTDQIRGYCPTKSTVTWWGTRVVSLLCSVTVKANVKDINSSVRESFPCIKGNCVNEDFPLYPRWLGLLK